MTNKTSAKSGDASTQIPLRRMVVELGARVAEQGILTESIIADCGVAQVLVHGWSEDGACSDYSFYCFTKACKSLLAAGLLVSANLSEDAMTILRTVYECYLHIAFLSQHPDRVDDFVAIKLAIHSGRFQPKLGRKGNRVRGWYVDPTTGQEYRSGIGVNELVEGTGAVADRAVHDVIYPYLSEHIHPHIIALGNYHDGKGRFTIRDTSHVLEAALYAAYLGCLILAESRRLRQMVDDARVTRMCERTAVSIRRCLALMEFQEPYSNFPTAIRSRLKDVRQMLGRVA